MLAHLFLNYLLDLPNVLEQHLVERLHAAAHRGDAAGARQGADPAAVAHLDGGGAVRPSRPGLFELQLPVDADALWQQAWLVVSNGI